MSAVALILLPGLAIVAGAYWLMLCQHREAWVQSRMRMHRDEQATAALRAELAAEHERVARARVQRIVDAYHCDRAPVSFGPQLAANDATTMALREVA